jgi:hypothetical protein
LISKKVPQLRTGQYDFFVSFNKSFGNNAPPIPYQTTRISVTILAGYKPEQNPIVIDSMEQGNARGAILFLTGTFPANTPLYYFVGSAPYNGAFGNVPSAVSTDGRTLVLPGTNGQQYEGRVILMLPDGSFSTTSAQTFVPALNITFPAPPSIPSLR